MTDGLLAGLLLNFAAVVGAVTMKGNIGTWSSLTYNVAGILMSTGTIAGLIAIIVFIKDQGFGYGLLYWALSGFVLSFLVWRIMDGFRSVLALIALPVGLYFAYKAIM